MTNFYCLQRLNMRCSSNFEHAALCTMRLHVMQRTVLRSHFRPFVCLSKTCIVTKRKKLVPTFLYHMKGQTNPVGAKTSIVNRYSLVAPYP